MKYLSLDLILINECLGGKEGDTLYRDILEFSSGEWTKLDEMEEGRSNHAVSVLSIPISEICILDYNYFYYFKKD